MIKRRTALALAAITLYMAHDFGGSYDAIKRIDALERAQALYSQQYEDAAAILQAGAGMLNEAGAREARIRAIEGRMDGELPSVGKSYAQWEGMRK